MFDGSLSAILRQDMGAMLCSRQPHRANSPGPATHSRTWASLQARGLELATSLSGFFRKVWPQKNCDPSIV